MAKLIPSPKFHVEKSDGTPASGWKVNTYEPGTSTRKATYTTSAEAVQNANPVVLDSRGEADIWWSGSYKVVVTDENDVVIYTVDNYSLGDSTSTADNYNLAENGSFEIESAMAETPEGWTVTDYTGGSHVLDNTANSHGLVSLKFTSTGGGGGYASTDFIPVEELVRYGIFFSIKSSAADVRNVVEVIWYTDAQATVSTSTPYDESAANPTSWTRYNYYVSAPSTARYAKIKIYGCHSSDATTGSTWFDYVVFAADEYNVSFDATAGTQPTYTLSPKKPIAAYVSGQVFNVQFHSAGTTGSNTLNINSLGAKNLKQYDTSGNKVPAIIYANMISEVAYDGTDIVLLNAIKYTAAPVRQTVLSSDLDSTGVASFISAGSGLACNLSATAPLIMTHAYGFNTTGAVDYISSIISASTGYWSSLTASNTSYLYIDRNTSTGALSAGSTLHPPQYDYSYDRTKCALLNFEAADASTSMIDAYGNTWTASGNAQIDTAQFKFGTSSLLLDGTGDYVSSSSITSVSKEDGFTMHCWVRWNSLPGAGARQQVFTATNAGGYGAGVNLYNNAGTTRLEVYLSSNGTSYNIATGTTGSKTSWSTGTWYHVALTYDGATYRVYVDGVSDIAVASTSKACAVTSLIVGATVTPSNYMNGWIDAFELLPYPLFTTATSFTPPAAARTVEGNFFSIPEMKMYTVDSASASAGTNPGMTALQRLFVGEAVTGAATVSSVVNYALRGEYDSNTFSAAVDTTYTKNHNIGGNPFYVTNVLRFRESASYKWGVTEQATTSTRNSSYIRSGTANVGGGATFTTAGAQSTNPITSADWRLFSKRAF